MFDVLLQFSVMSSAFDLDRFRENPFDVLGVATHATRQEVERAGQKLLGMLELGISSAKSYQTAFGPMERTPERVRAALAELRDPERRLVHELWAGAQPDGTDVARELFEEEEQERYDAPWPEAPAIIGLRGAR